MTSVMAPPDPIIPTPPVTTTVPEPSEILGTLLLGTIGAGYLLKRDRKLV